VAWSRHAPYGDTRAQNDYRDLTRSQALVLGENGKAFGVRGIQPLALGSIDRCRTRAELLGADFHRDVRIDDDVVVPVGMCRRATL
jgi:hypothetical protein